ncbi:MAG TPA: ABC transporter permease [Candidatus Blautia faecipullorum]|nr:ABC transporter permease [Candidatus Blautia faecipullorum]
MQKIIEKITKKKELGVLLMILILSALITIVNSSFLTLDNIFDFLRSNATIGIMAFGMLPVLISGGIDLSCSSVISLCAVVAGYMMAGNPEMNPLLVVFLIMLLGGFMGLINGLIITKLKIPPIVTTLGTQTIILAGVLLYTNGMWISGLPQWFIDFGKFQLGAIDSAGKTVGISTQAILMFAAAFVTWLILKFTLTGRGIYAIGGNRRSALRIGYNVDRIEIFIYVYAGLMTGLAAIANISIVGQVDPNTYLNYEMDVISVVVLGGASVMGGVGNVFGTVLGVILMAVIKNGLVLARVPTYWQKVVMGLIILITISADVINRKREQAKLVRVDVEE